MMKYIKLYICLAFLVMSESQLVTAAKPKEKEITVPCMDKGRSDSQYFRAASSAKSSSQISSKDKSMLVTKQLLSSLIGSTIKSVSNNFSKSIETSKVDGFMQSFDNLTNEFVNQQLRFITITCQTSNKNKDGMFETFTAIEMPKELLFEQLNNSILQDNKLKVDYDQAKFKEIFDAEMKKLE